MIDCILLHPNGAHGIYGDLADDLTAIEQPLWARILAAYLIDRGFTAEIIDADAERLGPDETAARVKASRPKIVAIVVAGSQPSGSTQTMPACREFAAAIKQAMPHQDIIFTGNHPSALPVRTLQEEPTDFVADGEGCATIEGLLRGHPMDAIPGLVWSFGKEIVQNPRAPLLDMDRDLHGQAWHLLKMPLYRSSPWQRYDDLSKRQPYAAIHTSLGCSFACHFCMVNIFQHTNRYRMRSPEAVVAELVMLNRDYGVETFKFTDELFILNRRHVTAICNGIIEAGLGDTISSWIYGRTDCTDRNLLSLLRRAGFRWIALGIESGSKNVRDDSGKGLRSDDIVGIVRAIEDAGIDVISNFIIGLPTDDMTSMQATLDMALDLNTSAVNFYVGQNYPGSKMYDDAVASGARVSDDWRTYSQHAYETQPADTQHVRAEEVLRFRDAAFQTYYTNPRYLSMIREKFGDATLEHIKAMTAKTIRRKLLEPA
jgi:radical SAM superfamily enzyme YgiQ (UPF0313 family)